MDEHKKFLADRLLSEEQPVSGSASITELKLNSSDHLPPLEQGSRSPCQHCQTVGEFLSSLTIRLHPDIAYPSMLYDFHQYQNALRAGSVHATYLVYGVKSAKTQHENGDVGMSSSIPEPESSSEAVPTHTLTLVCEENLEGG